MTDANMTIREMCDAFEVSPRTLRFYEAKELLFPIREGQKRWFTKRDRARLKLILEGKRFGFSLEDIRQLLDLYDQGPNGPEIQLAQAYELAQKRLAEMKAERDELTAAISALQERLAWAAERLEKRDQNAA
ncbi:MerR family transcriptional regulator [Frigidibacter sp. ROC022]|uniref:MerR family transcriptional regulator n=1 Tax=Frigidibacter sp. ROC022 TaxID=2971796 RepID=UPI00215A8DD8|nr:MerR family DNA-binding transcriptional regulator [Frigidibacter sp. ROC022]MCR8723147.1 MerR family DNA-binding transcriptional regulator [Frigidibacter sp. ROC022]